MIEHLVAKNIKFLLKVCPIEKIQILNYDLVLIAKPNMVYDILLFFKFHVNYQFEILTCISGVDYPKNKYRFQIVYELLSIKYNTRVRIKTFLDELIVMDSCNGLFLTGIWLESEIWDMFGIFFKNHPGLKKILSDYGFEGFPLRKDFPLVGFMETRYHNTLKKVINEILNLNQEYRTFFSSSPWDFCYQSSLI